ncbi:MAG: tRNA glutamyl-Q(34) synthetase GluQRS [Granulosicoccaceae bacterium]
MREYIGRFAPSPSGPLHLGSLAAALASYLQARTHRGRWLLRIEDIDPPREPLGAAAAILACLQAHRLHHDGPVSYQSQHHAHYDAALQQLRTAGRLYACNCTRAMLKEAAQRSGRNAYRGTCRDAQLPEPGHALRLRLLENCHHAFIDAAMGSQQEDLNRSCGDFVLRRRDGLYAYQLAVVVDDGLQGVTEVVRGADLLDNTARQIHLQQALGYRQPSYLHIPLLLDQDKRKLSKQNHAPALVLSRALENLESTWRALKQDPLPKQSSCESFLALAATHWNPNKLSTGGAKASK